METTENTKIKTKSEPPRKKSDPNIPVVNYQIDWNSPDLIIEDIDGDYE